jgi:hypothetical protein
MKYLASLQSPFKAATIALGAMFFVSGCETTSGFPEVCDDPQVVPRDSRCPPLVTPAKRATKPYGSDY